MLETVITILHVVMCVALIFAILLQSGKGGGVSAAFGGGAGQALGQRSAATVLGKFTAVAATIFMVTSMVLAIYSTPSAMDKTLDYVDEQGGAAPAAPATTDAPPADAPATDAPAAPAAPAMPAPKPAAPAGDAPAAPAAPAGDAPAAPAAPAGDAPAAPAAPAGDAPAAPAAPAGDAPAAPPGNP